MNAVEQVKLGTPKTDGLLLQMINIEGVVLLQILKIEKHPVVDRMVVDGEEAGQKW